MPSLDDPRDTFDLAVLAAFPPRLAADITAIVVVLGERNPPQTIGELRARLVDGHGWTDRRWRMRLWDAESLGLLIANDDAHPVFYRLEAEVCLPDGVRLERARDLLGSA